MMSPLLRKMSRKQQLDFSDYLELRQARDAGHSGSDVAEALAWLEERLPVLFGARIPHLQTLADAPMPPPRGLDRAAVRVMFAMRAEFADHGAARRSLMGFDLPDAEGLKDWLDFVENERRHAMALRQSLRELDRRIWAVYTGERKMPVAPAFRT